MILVTRNEKKIEDFRLCLGDDFSFKVMKVKYPELHSDDSCEIATTAAKALADRLREAVIVEDSGLFISALGGFPGTCTRYIHERICNKGIIKLMKSIKKRGCEYVSAVGYCEPGKRPICFLGVEKGKIANRLRGKKGWGQDSIFIPQGKNKTYGELRKRGDVNLFRKKAIEKLKVYLDRG